MSRYTNRFDYEDMIGGERNDGHEYYSSITETHYEYILAEYDMLKEQLKQLCVLENNGEDVIDDIADIQKQMRRLSSQSEDAGMGELR